MDWTAKKQERIFKEFYEKTGIQLTEEPIVDSKIEEELVEKFYYASQEQPNITIPKLEKAVKEHPEIYSIKNYLYGAYVRAGKNKEAEAILERTLQEHPDYLFGVTNKILRTHDKEEILKIGHLLREPRDVREFEGYDKPVHISSFKNYQNAVAHYEMMIGEDNAAVKRLDLLIDLEVEQPFLDEMARNLSIVRMKGMVGRLGKRNEFRRDVSWEQKVYLTEQTEEAPLLTHPELAILYETSTEALTEEQQQKILSLPKATLIEDLEKIVEDTMKRWEYFQTTEYDKNTREFTYHAVYLLSALESEVSLQRVLDLFRMGKDFMDFWFGDYTEEVFFPALYALGKGQLDELQSFAVEENIDGFDKAYTGKVVSQIALHQPERRGEVVQWFQNVFQTFIDQSDNDDLIDTTFLTLSVGYIIDFRGVELLPLVEQLNENNWIDDAFQGDIVKIRKRINEEYYQSELEPFPENIQEYYSKEYTTRKIRRPMDEESMAIMEQFNSKGEQLITKFWMSSFSGLGDREVEEEWEDPYLRPASVKTIKREGPKVGRNDPCPCGSGKKYKKCCL